MSVGSWSRRADISTPIETNGRALAPTNGASNAGWLFDAFGNAPAKRDIKISRGTQPSRQDGVACRLEGRRDRRELDAKEGRRRRHVAAPQGPDRPRLWTFRPPRGAAVLRRRRRAKDPSRATRSRGPIAA